MATEMWSRFDLFVDLVISRQPRSTDMAMLEEQTIKIVEVGFKLLVGIPKTDITWACAGLSSILIEPSDVVSMVPDSDSDMRSLCYGVLFVEE